MSGFLERHLGSNQTDIEAMLKECGVPSVSELIDRTIPSDIRYRGNYQLPRPRSETEALAALKAIASENRTLRSLIGMGYSDCVTPPVILRNLFENPGWYTQYTPYQAEISQGRLEALLNFQTMICDLTAMEIANASMLDEATAAAEAMAMAYGVKGNEKRNKFVVSEQCHPQVVSVVRTRARALGIQVVLTDHRQVEPNSEMFGALVSYPATNGLLLDYHGFAEEVHDAGGLVIVAADLLCLTLCVPPGEFGADIVVGNAQRFGVPLGFGGPHAAFFATRNTFRRQMPGRLVGVSKDARGKPAYRLSLQTREQHIRREKATSNICTAQALLANMAVMYAIYHGPHGLKRIAETIHRHAGVLAEGLKAMGFTLAEGAWFDTLCVRVEGSDKTKILENARENGINLRALNEGIGIALDEKTTSLEIESLLKIFNAEAAECLNQEEIQSRLPAVLEKHGLRRQSGFLQHPIFNSLHTETEMMRYLKRLENRDLSLTASMIPLGSCTMKLNAAAEMYPVTWPEFANIHPFAPDNQIDGYRRLFSDLETWLAEITGLKHVSLQPNAGSQGEYAGLLAIRRYFESNGQSRRDVCLIPQSAHGTNPASAVMAGLKVVVVQCDEGGNIDLEDLKRKAADHRERLAALMITYPSTHGVFEEDVREICAVIHEQGGLVYMDGANMNAQVGLCRPAEIGADVCHLNLHKTFCIPHGGGGPGMGPIAVREKLAVFLPGHPVEDGEGAVSSAPWGSSSILPISWMFIAMMGETGLRRSTELAILNANYIAKRLDPFYPILYKGKNGCVAHECIVDLRPFKCVTVEDVAKRLMDYGFHAPTISWPVAGTMMIEPTESESKAELDRFCEAMIAIHAEILEIEAGRMDKQNNLLKNAPHTADQIASDDWDRPYGRRQAAYPKEWLLERKFWPASARIDNVYGDRNLVCSCPDVKDYE